MGLRQFTICFIIDLLVDMKIVILSFYSRLLDRGVETWAENLKNKIGRGFEVEIIHGKENANDWFSKLTLFSKNVFDNLGEIRKADIVVPTNGSVQTFFCRIICFVWRKPMVIFGHSGPGADDKWNLLCSPDVFVAFSKAQKKWVEKYKLPWTKVKLIHHAVDSNKFKPVKKKPRRKTVLCVAANIPSKRVALVEKAVESLPGYRFVAVGKGNETEVGYDKIQDVYKEADVFCFVPWEREAFGLVFLEAMASNLPVVTINDKTRTEIVGTAGIFVKNPENSTELAKAIEKAYKTNWGNKPRKQAEKFGWEKVSKEYEKLFKNLAL